MLKKFPFGDSLLKDLEIINPENILCSNNSKDAQKVSICDSKDLEIINPESVNSYSFYCTQSCKEVSTT